MNKESNKEGTPFYITTTLPYVNSKAHVGFATEIIRADVIARFKRILGHDVFFNTGTDEHGIKIFQKALELGKDTQEFVDGNAEHFKNLKNSLNLSWDAFTRTTDKHHKSSAQAFWKLCDERGFIYKKKYSGLYCVGCEMFVTEKELIEGNCPNHPTQKPEMLEEENYFFKYSEFGDELLKLYETGAVSVYPANRVNEIKQMVANGLEDFSISRLKEKMPWGVPVPGDDEHVMYVWFDALTNYISTLGWPEDSEKFEKYWKNGTPVQYCGKDNLQHQGARWQAMLLAGGLPPTRDIVVDGFLTSGGQKMSKSIGNVIDPQDIVEKYGTDALRYFVLRELHPFEDSDFTIERFEEAYNAHLANGIGNLTNRILKMSEDNIPEGVEVSDIDFPKEYTDAFEVFNLQVATDIIWKKIGEIDEQIQNTQPFKVIKEDKEKGVEIIKELVQKLYEVSILLSPIIPETAEKIQNSIKENKKPETPIFARLD